MAATGAVLLSRLSAQVGDAVTGTEGLRRVVLIAGFRETLLFLAAFVFAPRHGVMAARRLIRTEREMGA